MKQVLAAISALLLLFTLTACGEAKAVISTPESGSAAPVSEQKQNDYAAELRLEEFTVIGFDKDGPGDMGCAYTLTAEQQAELLALLDTQKWEPAGELPAFGLFSNGVLANETADRSLSVSDYDGKTLLWLGVEQTGYFAPIGVSKAFADFAKPFRLQAESDKSMDSQPQQAADNPNKAPLDSEKPMVEFSSWDDKDSQVLQEGMRYQDWTLDILENTEDMFQANVHAEFSGEVVFSGQIVVGSGEVTFVPDMASMGKIPVVTAAGMNFTIYQDEQSGNITHNKGFFINATMAELADEFGAAIVQWTVNGEALEGCYVYTDCELLVSGVSIRLGSYHNRINPEYNLVVEKVISAK